MAQPADVTSASRYEDWRLLKDRITRYLVAVGGTGVIIAILLIFFYLFWVVFPLFVPASADRVASFATPAPEAGPTLLLATDELGEMGVRYTNDGHAVFFDLVSGKPLPPTALLAAPAPGQVTVAVSESAASSLVALGLADGSLLPIRHRFKVSYPNDVRTITPEIEYPYGEEPVAIDDAGQPLSHVAIRDSDDRFSVAAITADHRVVVRSFEKQTNLITEESTLEPVLDQTLTPPFEPDFLLLDPYQTTLYLANRGGDLARYTLAEDELQLAERVRVVAKGELTALRFLLGGFSLLVGNSQGEIAQWMPVRDAENRTTLQRIRSFDYQQAPILAIEAESRRKGFLAADAEGYVGVYHSTADRKLLVERIADQAVTAIAISPRGDTLLARDAKGGLQTWRLHNEHPEVSWSALWGKVQYEGHSEPKYIWQSSAATNDFEPKFSLTPLAFGTIKAAFFAMLVAVPLAILGAIYTAYFMSPAMRQLVKPTIEIMEALPTVILGFLAGLWLAPFVEHHLFGVFAIFFALPFSALLFAWVWHNLPERIRGGVPEGWEALLLIPVLLLAGWLVFVLGPPFEGMVFGEGGMRTWVEQVLGIDYDQRNALVVGIAMGFAVIPNIFSITEDAVFSVPKHLTFGSLALGATPWQTLSRVVILTASPGIFSAVMIGMGRAVGETMIVLMATGNTPVMDLSLFQGMRTLSANIAVEMPESEVGSTHYRVLFLAAFVLFLFTFLVNTLAEVVRQRLRRKYSNL